MSQNNLPTHRLGPQYTRLNKCRLEDIAPGELFMTSRQSDGLPLYMRLSEEKFADDNSLHVVDMHNGRVLAFKSHCDTLVYRVKWELTYSIDLIQ